MWRSFTPTYLEKQRVSYPFAIKVATGRINAITGDAWTNDLHTDPQDYVDSHTQPWLDGYCIEQGIVRQFVATPLGTSNTAEEQVTGEAFHGGLQILVCPMKADVFHQHFPSIMGRTGPVRPVAVEQQRAVSQNIELGLAASGRMRQKIHESPFDINDWDIDQASRCFIHIANSPAWHSITGEEPPTTAPTAREYTEAGLPWYDFYGDGTKLLKGSRILSGLKSIFTLGKQRSDVSLPENNPVDIDHIITIRGDLR